MKKTNKTLGYTVIAATTLAALFALSTTSCFGQSGGGGRSINSAHELKAYLVSQPANSPDKPINVTMKVNNTMLKSISTVIKETGKYVSLDLSDSPLTKIPDNYKAFDNCKTLVGIIIPNSVTSIGDDAFGGCISLTSVNIPSGVTSIGRLAFSDCTSLTSITIPNSVTSIGRSAFIYCTSLISITFGGTIPSDGFTINTFGDSLNNVGYIGDIYAKHLAGGIGTYTRPSGSSRTWTKQ
jgi:hypothetical protein